MIITVWETPCSRKPSRFADSIAAAEKCEHNFHCTVLLIIINKYLHTVRHPAKTPRGAILWFVSRCTLLPTRLRLRNRVKLCNFISINFYNLPSSTPEATNGQSVSVWHKPGVASSTAAVWYRYGPSLRHALLMLSKECASTSTTAAKWPILWAHSTSPARCQLVIWENIKKSYLLIAGWVELRSTLSSHGLINDTVCR